MTKPHAAQVGAFTLLEMLIVVTLIAVLAVVIGLGFSGGEKSAALGTAQVTVANVMIATRMRAISTGHAARMLINSDIGSPDRYLRQLVVQEFDPASGTWESKMEVNLPPGTYLLPQQNKTPAGLLENDVLWRKADNSTVLHSSIFSAGFVSERINGTRAESWVAVEYNYRGTTTTSGAIVLSAGQMRAPGSYSASESPVRLLDSANVRGLSVTSYGMVTYLNGREAF